jgi:Zn-dependent membrane protease YugP
MPFFYFDPLFLILSIPPLLLGLWAQMRVKGAFAQYSTCAPPAASAAHRRRAASWT